jgi:hypothetical protein
MSLKSERRGSDSDNLGGFTQTAPALVFQDYRLKLAFKRRKHAPGPYARCFHVRKPTQKFFSKQRLRRSRQSWSVAIRERPKSEVPPLDMTAILESYAPPA